MRQFKINKMIVRKSSAINEPLSSDEVIRWLVVGRGLDNENARFALSIQWFVFF